MAFPGYTVVSELGKGGFATVYLAHADEDGETVAIKQFLTEHGAALDREKAANERACIERRAVLGEDCLLYTSPSPRDKRQSRMPSSA